MPSGMMALVANEDRAVRVADLLTDNIRTEIVAQNAACSLGLTSEIVENLTRGIAAEVLYAFAVEWSPHWVKPGRPHSWESSGEHFSRCGICLQDSPPFATREDAQAWAINHEAIHKG